MYCSVQSKFNRSSTFYHDLDYTILKVSFHEFTNGQPKQNVYSKNISVRYGVRGYPKFDYINNNKTYFLSNLGWRVKP